MGPLLRIGDDRFIPGLRNLVETVKRKSRGHTRLFIQIIDFLSVRRRPPKDKYFARFLELKPHHRAALAGATSDTSWLEANEADIRVYLNDAPDELLDRVLDERELESLRYGYRERVTDIDLQHIRELPRMLPGFFADAAGRAREAGYGGSRENRARLPLEVYGAVRARVGDGYTVGVRFLGDEVIERGSHLED